MNTRPAPPFLPPGHQVPVTGAADRDSSITPELILVEHAQRGDDEVEVSEHAAELPWVSTSLSSSAILKAASAYFARELDSRLPR